MKTTTNTIALVCPKCKRITLTPRSDYDPQKAIFCVFLCPRHTENGEDENPPMDYYGIDGEIDPIPELLEESFNAYNREEQPI